MAGQVNVAAPLRSSSSGDKCCVLWQRDEMVLQSTNWILGILMVARMQSEKES